MKHLLFTLLFFYLLSSPSLAQFYSETQKTPVATKEKKIKPVKTIAKLDTTPYLGAGFTLSATAGITRGTATNGYYHLKVLNKTAAPNEDYYYKIKNSFGYRIGIAPGFHGKKFGIEIPITYNVDRFKVPQLSAKEHIKISSFEIAELNYFKLMEEKHAILFGPYFSFALKPRTGLYNAGFNFGYEYNVIKNLNVSFRFKSNFFNIAKNNNSSSKKTILDIEKNSGADVKGSKITDRDGYYHSIQLVARYTLVNTRKIKTPKPKKIREPKPKKEKVEKVAVEKNNANSNYNNNYDIQPVTPVKQAIDYSTYSDVDLSTALKTASSTSDLDAMLAIQKEIDLRKTKNQFTQYSYVQLQDQLNKALDKEDYTLAELIKKEMTLRETKKGMPTDSKTKPATKKTTKTATIKETTTPKVEPKKVDSLDDKSLAELTKMLDEAVSKEDYKKAEEIQNAINKKK